MKKLYNRITEFSLFQQLVIIIFTIVFTLGVFYLVYLKTNVNEFVTSRVMELLQRSQESTVYNITYGLPGTSTLTYDKDVMHFIYDDGQFSSYYGRKTYPPVFRQNVSELLNPNLEKGESNGGTFDSNGVYYYRQLSLGDGRQIISVISESYANVIENALISSITNVSALVIMVLMLVLMLWVLTIIAPLQQMRSYLEKVKKGDETATLKLDRKDEIGELATAMVEMHDQLKHEEETKEEMVHNISHDLKTPIATIKSYAQSIKDGIYPYDTLEKSVDVILENANRLEHKVYSLLFLNRLDYVMDQERDTDKTTDMKEIITKVVTSLKMIHPGIMITKNLEPALFKGDEESWRIVVENLLDNALRYASQKISIDLTPYTLTIYNDGEPISDERMTKLFKPFEKGSKGQFGLGLSICYKVCNTYGYNIDAENQEQGVAFKIVCRNIPKQKNKLFERRPQVEKKEEKPKKVKAVSVDSAPKTKAKKAKKNS